MVFYIETLSGVVYKVTEPCETSYESVTLSGRYTFNAYFFLMHIF